MVMDSTTLLTLLHIQGYVRLDWISIYGACCIMQSIYACVTVSLKYRYSEILHFEG